MTSSACRCSCSFNASAGGEVITGCGLCGAVDVPTPVGPGEPEDETTAMFSHSALEGRGRPLGFREARGLGSRL